MNKKTISILIFLSTLTLVVNCSIITIFADNYDDTSEPSMLPGMQTPTVSIC